MALGDGPGRRGCRSVCPAFHSTPKPLIGSGAFLDSAKDSRTCDLYSEAT